MGTAVLVGVDKAPSEAGERLAKALRQEGVAVNSFLSHGKPTSSVDDIIMAARTADVVWTGISSSEKLALPEVIAAREAIRKGTPLAVYADIEGCQNRAWFEEFRATASLLFVLTERERKNAVKTWLGRVIATGNPTHEDFAFPELSREEVRSRLKAHDDESLILALGTKSIPITSSLVMTLLEVIKRSALMQRRKYFIALFTHPGDEGMQALVPVRGEDIMRMKPDMLTPDLTPYADNEGCVSFKPLNPYADLTQFSGDVRVEIMRGNKEFGTPQAIAGADAVVQCAGTEGRRAAYQGVPVIDFFSYLGLNRMREINKIDRWEPCELGMSYGVYNGNLEDFADQLNWALTPEGRKEIAAIQRKVCPKSRERGAAIEDMVAAMRPYLGI